MSDVVIVSADAFRNGELPEGRVPYGTIFDDDAVPYEGGQTIESIGHELSVDWRGIDQVDTRIGPPVKKRGRPRKVEIDE